MTRLHDGRLRRWMLQWAVVSMLLVQSIGLLHGVAHRPLPAGSPLAVSLQQAAPEVQKVQAFGHDRDSLDCRLYDQLAHADLAQGAATALPCGLGTAPQVAQAPAGHTPAFEQRYGARGPPAA